MKKFFLLAFSLIVLFTSLFAQNVIVNPGAGSYPTLKAAFDAINAGTHTGGVTVDIAGNTTETLSAVLNASGTGSAFYTSIVISPFGGASRTISGYIDGQLIDLNGADNVTIDGLNSGGNALSIDNSNGGSLASTIRFIDDAGGNTVTRCNLLGSSGISTGSGIGTVYFSTGTASGNDNNTITHCNISASVTGTPINAIYSSGSNAVVDNSINTISFNNISDFFNPQNSASGININTGNLGWTITNNALYQTATRTATTANLYNGIFISSGLGYDISNNVIGFASPNATGTSNYIGLTSGSLGGTFPGSFTVGGVANDTRYCAINCAFTPGSVYSSIQNNTIGGIAVYATGVSTTLGTLCGIAVQSGNANIGTNTGNTIGSVSGTSSLYAANTVTGGGISGIYCTTTNTIIIQKNTIGGIDVSGTSATTAAGFKGIETAGTGSYTISNNNIGNVLVNNIRTGYLLTGGNLSNTAATATAATGASAIQAIVNSSTGTTVNITNNTIRGFQMSGTETTFTGINNTGAVSTILNINNNNLGTTATGLLSIPFTNSGAVSCITSSASSPALALSISSNTFTGMSYATECTGSFRCINSTGSVFTETISTNNFNNLTVNSAASTIGFLISATNTSPAVTVNGNYVTAKYNNITPTGAVNFMAIACNGAATTTGASAISNNNLSNITFRTTTGFGAGIYWLNGNVAASVHNINVSNNVINNISNLGTATTANIYGILVGYGNNNTISGNSIAAVYGRSNATGLQTNNSSLNASGVYAVYNNRISDIVTSGGSATANGISCFAGPAQNIYKNKIYDIRSLGAGTVTGLFESEGTAGTTANIYNNIIGRLYAPNNGFYNGVTGIYIGSAAANTKNIYYNTVYLDGSNPTQSYCLYANSTIPVNNLRNNIFCNNVTATGGSLFPSVVYFRNGASSLGTYAATSDNNIFYAGTPGTSNIIYADGAINALTNITTTLASYQAFVTPREINSKTELPPFLSTSPGSNNSYLHIDPSMATQAESGAVNIPAYTDDYDADIRQGNPGYPGTSLTAPDIGADEFDLTVDRIAPDINYTALSSIVCTANRTFSAAITDYSGINITPGTLPRVYYKKSTNVNSLGGTNTNATDGWKYTEGTFSGGSAFSFTIDYSLVFGGVSAGDNIQYFVTAQDLMAAPNVGINSGVFATIPVSVVLTGTAFPMGGIINSYNIVLPIPTSITIGASGTYPSLSGTGGFFADMNTKGLSGNTVVNIIDAVVTETGANSINQPAYGCGGPYTLTIRPNAGLSVTLTGSNTNALLKLNGADNVIIDGINSGGSALKIINTNVAGYSVIWLASAGFSNGATNNIIKNCSVAGNSATATVAGIISGSGALIGNSAESPNSENNIQNCSFTAVENGIFVSGETTGFDQNWLIDNNTFGSTTVNADKLGYRGVSLQGVRNFTISNNRVNGVVTATSSTSTASGISIFSNSSNGNIFGNKIGDIKQTNTTGYGCNGIYLGSSSTASNIRLFNNFIFDVAAYGFAGASAADNGYGIIADAGGGYAIDFNSINMNTNQSVSTGLPAAINITSGITTAASVIMRNNIFSNSQTVGTERYSIYSGAANTVFAAIDYNDYYTTGPNLGFIGGNRANLAALQTGFGANTNSLNVQPNFTTATDLHLVAATNCALDGYGTPVAGITTDYDAAGRDATTPDMGADEFTATYSGTLAGIVSTTVCENKTVSAAGTTYATGVCDLIARVVPSGGSPVAGKINVCVTRDASQLSFNGEPYVQRHYDLEPAVSDQSTTSATITMYFTDTEFALYNTNNPAWPPLPTSAGGGNADPYIANLKVTQFHGTPTGGLPTSSPGNYTGLRILLTPVSVNLNGTTWSVTVDIAGFSGFYIHSNNWNTPLPVTLNYFKGTKQGSNHLLNWKVTCNNTPQTTMTLERSADSRNFSGINTITADAARCNQPFSYIDADPFKGMNYYRLKMTDADGHITYSSIVALLNAVKGFDIVSIAPNPVVNDNFKLNVASAQAGKLNISLFDMQGRLVNNQAVSVIAGFNSLPVQVATLAAGTYSIRVDIGSETPKLARFVKQ